MYIKITGTVSEILWEGEKSRLMLIEDYVGETFIASVSMAKPELIAQTIPGNKHSFICDLRAKKTIRDDGTVFYKNFLYVKNIDTAEEIQCNEHFLEVEKG